MWVLVRQLSCRNRGLAGKYHSPGSYRLPTLYTTPVRRRLNSHSRLRTPSVPRCLAVLATETSNLLSRRLIANSLHCLTILDHTVGNRVCSLLVSHKSSLLSRRTSLPAASRSRLLLTTLASSVCRSCRCLAVSVCPRL